MAAVGRAASLPALLRVLLSAAMHRDVLLLLLVAVSTPAALASAYSLVPRALEEAKPLLARWEGSSLLLLPPGAGAQGCTTVHLAFARVEAGGRALEAPVLLVDAGGFQGITGCRAAGEAPLSLGSLLAGMLGARPGSRLTLCMGGGCRSYLVSCIHGGGGLYAASIVLAAGAWSSLAGEEYRLCSVPGQQPVLEGLEAALSEYARILAYLVAAVYLPIAYMACRRAVQSLEGDIETLYSMGVPLQEARLALALALSLLGLLMSAYGVLLGVFAMHAALYTLRLFGAPAPLQPVPSPGGLVSLAGVFTAEAVAAAVAAVQRGG
ncbi:hypothetical protein [Pyrodictium occultum]|uniref:hypothetical protein n=1 Tax=Pyrodictium occultum TaxID=2309 RepID=UPI0014434560|nr:hypothetical protein [Pyrodictium occultum]